MVPLRLIEHQYCARYLACLHRAEDLAHVLQLAAAADHIVEIQPALQVVVDVARHIDAETVATHHCALDLALGQEHRPVELNFMTDRNHSDDRRGAAGLDALEALLCQLGNTDRLEGVINPPLGPSPSTTGASSGPSAVSL